MLAVELPSQTTVLVIGSGPAGSYTASVLAREGITTTVIEAAKFPRYHIGESMLSSINIFMRLIGAEEKLRNHGFTVKRGAATKLNQTKKEGYTDFVQGDIRNASWNVIRSELDDMLLRHAEESGALVFEETEVTDIIFEEKKGAGECPTMAYYRKKGGTGKIRFEYLVDASGRNGIMTTKYLRNRHINKSLHNIATWAYWKDHQQYMPDTPRQNAPWFEALTDESGWGWFIPLHNGAVSVGIVMDSVISSQKKEAGRKASSTGKYSVKEHYLDQFQFVPGVQKLLDGATMKDDDDEYSHIRSASDFSYAADKYAGDHYRIIGDASAFIDPFFSSGVHLALLGGLTAAVSIAASIKKQCTEAVAWNFHDVKVATAYTRFLLVVMSAYKQIRNQSMAVMADIDEHSFDRAISIFRPVIQGTADVGKKLTDDELEKTMDFCKGIFAPTDPEMIRAIGTHIRPELLSPNAPILTEEEICKEVSNDEEKKLVLRRLNARKPVNRMYQDPNNLCAEDVDGYIANLNRSQLGLVRKISA